MQADNHRGIMYGCTFRKYMESIVALSSSSFLHCFPFISFKPQITNGVCAKLEGVERGKGGRKVEGPREGAEIIRISFRTTANISAGIYFPSICFSILMSCIYFKGGFLINVYTFLKRKMFPEAKGQQFIFCLKQTH